MECKALTTFGLISYSRIILSRSYYESQARIQNVFIQQNSEHDSTAASMQLSRLNRNQVNLRCTLASYVGLTNGALSPTRGLAVRRKKRTSREHSRHYI
jgi:hypothetical protein